jgi:hypothetical protein
VAGSIAVARDDLVDGLELLAHLLRQRFGRNPRRSFVMLAAQRPPPGLSMNDQVTERIPILRTP